MIKLSSIIQTFQSSFMARYQDAILPSQLKALSAMSNCRSSISPVMLAKCDDCHLHVFVPHSCGHRNCPHCQSHESQQWLERQLKREVPADYFLITFTLPAAFRALAKVFRAKMLDAILKAELMLPASYPGTWVVDCKFAGKGEKALIYLGRYLYKGVLQEKDIVSCQDGKVSFVYQDCKSKKMLIRTLPGEEFLRLILRHVLPKGFRRTRNFGFRHPNSKGLIVLLQSLCGINAKRARSWLRARPKFTCSCCGGVMKIIKTSH